MENKRQEAVLKHRESERRRRERIKDKLNIIDEMTTGSIKSTLEQERILNQAIQHIQQLHDFSNLFFFCVHNICFFYFISIKS